MAFIEEETITQTVAPFSRRVASLKLQRQGKGEG